MDVERAVWVLSEALRTGAAAEHRDATPELVAVLRLLRGTLARLLGPDTPLRPEYGDLRVGVARLGEDDLGTLVGCARAVLALTDPRGVADGRYEVPGAVVTTVRHGFSAVASGSVPPPVPARATGQPPGPLPRPYREIDERTRALADRERSLGAEHPDTLAARVELAVAYLQVGRGDDAAELLRRVHAEHERRLGWEHPDTVGVRRHLVHASRPPSSYDALIDIVRRTLAEREQRLGGEHPDTVTARAGLAVTYLRAGRRDAAVDLLRQVVSARERVLGAEHPDTRDARETLADWLRG